MVLLHCLRFIIQLSLLLGVMAYYHFAKGLEMNGNWLFSIPAIILTAGLAFGAGLIFSVFTAMYRDLSNLQQLLIRLLMFLCPIFYALSMVPEKTRWIVNLNPLSPLFESFRYAFLGKGHVSANSILYSLIVTLILCTTGLLLFNKKGDKLMDVI